MTKFFMLFYLCADPVAPVRKEPSHRNEMMSQFSFGENVQWL